MPEISKILLLGAGGHCKSVLDSIISSYSYDSVGIIDKSTSLIMDENSNTLGIPIIGDKNSNVLGIPIIGDDNDLTRLFSEGYTEAFISVGSIGDVSLRKRLYTTIKHIGFHIPNIIDKSSVVSSSVVLGEGIYIGKNAVVNVNAEIGDCAIINTSAVIEHECRIGPFVHIAPGSILSGKVSIEVGTHIGSGSVIKQGIHIGADTMIGIGSVVLKDFGSKVTAYGNPCKEVEHE